MTTSTREKFELRVLGVPDLTAPDGRRVTSVLSQPSRLSLLAYLALAPGPVTRAAVVADFWPESDEARARNALSQALFYLRRSLGKEAVQNVEGDRLWVPPERVWCDARELLLGELPSEDVLGDAGGELLSGWNAEGSQPLQEWLDGVRRRVLARTRELEAAARARKAETRSEQKSGSEPTQHRLPATAVSGPDRPGAGAPRRQPAVWAPMAGATALVVLVLAVVLPLLGRTAVDDGTAESERLAVLLPRVTQLAGSPHLDPLRLNAEILASLPRRPDLQVVPASFASSLGELLGWRDAVDASTADPPDWILEVSVVVSAEGVHVVTVVHEGPGSSSPGRDSFDLPYHGPDDIAVQVPRAVAERVSGTVSDVMGR